LETRRFSLHIPEDLADWLEREAARQGRTRNNLINWILQHYRKEPRRVEAEAEAEAETQEEEVNPTE